MREWHAIINTNTHTHKQRKLTTELFEEKYDFLPFPEVGTILTNNVVDKNSKRKKALKRSQAYCKVNE